MFALARFGFRGGRTGVVVGVGVGVVAADIPGGGDDDGDADAAASVEKSIDFTKRCFLSSESGCNVNGD